MTTTWDAICRRSFLQQSGLSLGTAALASLLPQARPGGSGSSVLHGAEQAPFVSRGVVQPFHVPPKVKRVIFLYMSGGPSQFETFDYKPKLAELSGQAMPESFTKGQPIAQLQGQTLKCQGPLFKFSKHGQSGQEISEALPYTAKLADEICIIRSMQTDQINHDPAHTVMNTGTSISGRPSMGSWILYGLGSEAQDLPGFVVLTSFGGRNPQPISTRQWHSGFLPSHLQGVKFQSTGEPVPYLDSPPGVLPSQQRRVVSAVGDLNRLRQTAVDDPEISARIGQYELAFKMQTSIPELNDFRDEPQHILDLYGTKGGDGTFAANCLLARRLAERGARFIQLYHRDWDHHGDLVRYMKITCGLTDRPTWALMTDLKQRGMLDDTLIVWGGEFGRTPMFQGKGAEPGRDHHIRGFSMWLAGGGIRPGITHGATDELGYAAVDKPVHVHDLHATMLHLLGIDHTRLTYFTQGREFRLTDVAGKVVQEILA